MKRFFFKLLVAYLSTAMAIQPVIANDASSIGRSGQAFGQEIANSFKNSGTGASESGTITIPTLQNGQFSSGGGSLNSNDLAPGAVTENAPLSLEKILQMQSDDVMSEMGKDAKNTLWEDANSDNPSISGAAYSVVMDAANLSKPDMRNDPILNSFRQVQEELDVFSESFGDCSVQTSINSGTINTRIPDYQICTRVQDKSTTCEVTHDYEPVVVRHAGGNYNLSNCNGENNCKLIWVGRVADNNYRGNCTIFEEYTEIQVVNPQAITSVHIQQVKWDDHIQIWVGNNKVLQLPYSSQFPPETSGSCELSTSWNSHPNTDITSYFKNVEPGTVLRFKIRVSVTGAGEGYARLRLRYNPSLAISRDNWTPESCIQASKAIYDGFASGSVTCTDMPQMAGTCTTIEGFDVCENNLKPSPFPNISNVCRKVKVEANYDFHIGQMECFTDINGNQQCPVNTGEQTNGCAEFEQNPQCGFIKSECLDGAQGASGNCYVLKDTYDCGVDVAVPTLTRQDNYQCGGEIRCMGADCLDPTKEVSSDFARASAMLNAVQFMTQDMSCTGLDADGNPTGTEDVKCKVFSGEAGECKIAVGGAADCCEKPTGISMADYLTMIMQIPRIDAAIMSINSEGSMQAVKGAYQLMRDPVVSAWESVSQPVTSYIESASAATKEFFQPVTDYVANLTEQLKEKITTMTEDLFGNAAEEFATENAASSVATEGATEQAGEEAGNAIIGNAMNALSGVMAVYSAYMMAMMAIQMIYACEPDEMQMNAKRALDSCTYVGSYCKQEIDVGFDKVCIEERRAYCCYNSPLSRILQEQIKDQFGGQSGFGTPKNPQCGGIAIEDIEKIDWENVNLDEWLAILQQNGVFPNPNNLDISSLTGQGSALDHDGTRKDAVERNLERLEGIDLDQQRIDAGESLFLDMGAPYSEAGDSL